jgi:flagellar protein FliO/FliZ
MELSHGVSPVTVGSISQLSLSLFVVVGLIFAIAWAFKRFRVAGPRGRGDIVVLDELALGPRERIALIRVGESQVLVGIGANGVVALEPLATPIVLGKAAAVPPFAERLREFMKRPPSQGPSS